EGSGRGEPSAEAHVCGSEHADGYPEGSPGKKM
ncbi:hypothetical protein ATR1_008c0001, partial [Acetobacter tropicalis]